MNDGPYADEDYHPPGAGCLLSIVLMMVAWAVIFFLLWNFA